MSILKPVDTIVFIGANQSVCNVIRYRCFWWIVVPISAGLACALSLGKNITNGIFGKK